MLLFLLIPDALAALCLDMPSLVAVEAYNTFAGACRCPFVAFKVLFCLLWLCRLVLQPCLCAGAVLQTEDVKQPPPR